MKQQAVTNSQGNDVSLVKRSNEEKNQVVHAFKPFEAQKKDPLPMKPSNVFELVHPAAETQ